MFLRRSLKKNYCGLLFFLFCITLTVNTLASKTKERLTDSVHNMNAPKISYLQQSTPAPASEDSGSILDDQNIVIDNSNVKLITSASSSDGSPRKAAENAAESDDMNDRLNHFIAIEQEKNGGEPEIVTTPTVTPEEKAAAQKKKADGVTYKSTKETAVPNTNGYNYKLKQFDSSVKKDVYPSPETDSMITWGVIFLVSMMVLIFLLKSIMD